MSLAPSVLYNAGLTEVVLERSGSGSQSLWSELTPPWKVDGFLRFSFAKASCSDVYLESRVPGAEGPVALLHLGEPHPDRSEALQWVTPSSGPRKLTALLSHLVRENAVWVSGGGWAGHRPEPSQPASESG